MKRFLTYICLWGMVFTFASCVSLQPISYERLQAADVNFLDAVRKVGVVNAVPETVDQQGETRYVSGRLEGDGKVAAEILAQEIAATDYFDVVVIGDSTLHVPETWSLKEVEQLTQTLDVDLVFVLEQLPIQLKEGRLFVPEWMSEVSSIDGIVKPVLKAYISGRSQPLFMINQSDTLSWPITSSLTYGTILKEASEYAGVLPVKHLLPHWKEVYRYYFDGGNVEMRDAGVCVREEDWQGAAELWQVAYDKKKGKSKMRAAYNLALFYEMQNDFEKAKEYLEVAAGLVPETTFDYQLISHYLLQLEQEVRSFSKLKLQMNRFEQ